MSKTSIVSVSIALATACLLASGAALAATGKHPGTYTCADLLAVDVEEIPQVVYWLDGYNWAGDPVYSEEVDWVPVETDTVIVECKKNPSQKAANVVKQQRKSAKSKSTKK